MAKQVLGYDGTEGARAVLQAVTALAAELGDSLVVVFAHQVSVVREGGVEVELVLRESSPAEALIEVADEHDARLIAVGSYGERPLKSALVGSTPTRLLHLSERPVLVVRAPE